MTTESHNPTAAEAMIVAARFIETSAREASADGDQRVANALHAAAMALAACARRRDRGDDADAREYDRRAALAAREFFNGSIGL